MTQDNESKLKRRIKYLEATVKGLEIANAELIKKLSQKQGEGQADGS